jgi:hypothetical protein
VAAQDVGRRGVGHQPGDHLVRIVGLIPHHDPSHQWVRPRRIGLDGAGHQGVNDLVRHIRVCFRGRGGNGFQVAIALTKRRAAALSVIPGKCRRSSIAADSSPLSLNTRRMASAVASLTLNMAPAWAAELQRTSNFADLTTPNHAHREPRQRA